MRSRAGVASTARLITGAALIIVVVFLGFAMGDLIMFQQMGFGVAVALLIDATVIRSVLVPAAMTLLGTLELVPAELAQLAAGGAHRGAKSPSARRRLIPRTTPAWPSSSRRRRSRQHTVDAVSP